MRVIWSPAALADIGRIYDYISAFNPAAAAGLVREFKSCGDSLRDFPERGRPIANRRREVVVIWPYVVRYRVVRDDVQILRVRHGRQRPLP
ncbi:MAG: type II toxin-antitoxin system RelE/ParE family toxin [Alphaproteobacteria bacterium]|nr:type II toxin-antitoxin system RelE/ParE family toxin [Alphaproteobacteria bacterium]